LEIPRTKKIKEPLEAAWTAREKALAIAEIARAKKAEDIILLQVEALSSIGDYYVVCSADSAPQMRAIVDAVEITLSQRKCRPLGIEGMRATQWVLVDCNDVILHIFHKEARVFYNLDRLWGDAPRTDILEPAVIVEKSRPEKKKRKVG